MSRTAESPVFDARSFLQHVTSMPGVYRMYGAERDILYVGKAKNLKKRLASYFRSTGLSVKTRALVEQIQHIEVTIKSPSPTPRVRR